MSELDATFKPFETHLNLEKTNSILKESLLRASDGELFLEKNTTESLVFDDSNLRQSALNSRQGFGLRAVSDEKIGFSHSSNITEAAIKEAGTVVRRAIDNNENFKDRKDKSPKGPKSLYLISIF